MPMALIVLHYIFGQISTFISWKHNLNALVIPHFNQPLVAFKEILYDMGFCQDCEIFLCFNLASPWIRYVHKSGLFRSRFVHVLGGSLRYLMYNETLKDVEEWAKVFYCCTRSLISCLHKLVQGLYKHLMTCNLLWKQS